MADNTDLTAQSNRITFMVMDLMGRQYRGVEFSVGPNDAKDRVTANIGKGVAIEFGPEDWALNDDELRQLIERRVHGVIRAKLP